MRRTNFVLNPSSTKSLSGWIINKRTQHREVPAIATEYLAKILTSQVYEAAIETPLTYAPTISNNLKNDVYLKREDMQPVFSFKIRGAYNKIAKLSPELRAKGVVTCSAGNHAQGVAMSASKLNINAIIVMPIATPAIKVNAVRRFGGPTVTVKLHGQNYDEAAAEAKRLEIEMGLTLVHPFDDPDVIAGQGTIGMEIIKVKRDVPSENFFTKEFLSFQDCFIAVSSPQYAYISSVESKFTVNEREKTGCNLCVHWRRGPSVRCRISAPLLLHLLLKLSSKRAYRIFRRS